MITRRRLPEDERFRRVVERGTEVATPGIGPSVHAEPHGLRPAASYSYRFRVDGAFRGYVRCDATPRGRV